LVSATCDSKQAERVEGEGRGFSCPSTSLADHLFFLDDIYLLHTLSSAIYHAINPSSTSISVVTTILR
jgi:hypothetical protein